jgi:hypothetical protein
MMKCTQVKKHIPLLVGGDLDPGTGQQLMEHMKGCLGCYREYQKSQRALESLRGLQDRPDLGLVLNGLAQDVMAELNATPSGPAAGFPRPWLASATRFAAAAAVVLILVGGAFMLGQSQGTASGPGTDAADTYQANSPRNGGEGGSFYPNNPGYWAGERNMKEADGETEFIRTLDPQTLPTVRPASHRRGF